MKPDIGKDYVSLCSPHVPFTDPLFGDGLQKQLKDIGDVNKKGQRSKVIEALKEIPRITTTTTTTTVTAIPFHNVTQKT